MSRSPLNLERCEDAVRGLEQRYGISLPNDFRSHLLKLEADGDGGYWVENVDWWPIDRVRNIPEEYEHPVRNPQIAERATSYLFFADYAIWCWAWAICCDDSEDRGKVAIVGGAPDRIVATSFSEFRELGRRDPHFMSSP